MFCIYYDNGLNGSNKIWGDQIYAKEEIAWTNLLRHIDRLRNNPTMSVYQDTNMKRVVVNESLRQENRCSFWVGLAKIAQ